MKIRKGRYDKEILKFQERNHKKYKNFVVSLNVGSVAIDCPSERKQKKNDMVPKRQRQRSTYQRTELTAIRKWKTTCEFCPKLPMGKEIRPNAFPCRLSSKKPKLQNDGTSSLKADLHTALIPLLLSQSIGIPALNPG